MNNLEYYLNEGKDITLEDFTKLSAELNARVDKAEKSLKSFGKNGVVTDDERTAEYTKAKRDFDIAFKELQTLNKSASKKVKRDHALAKRKW